MQNAGDRSEENLAPPSVSLSVPPPPWELAGAAVVFLHSWRSVLALVRYDVSPVGPYEELTVAALTLRGLTVTEMLVNAEASMIGGRRGWGFPKVPGDLRWEQSNQRIVFHAGRRKYRVKATALALPVKLSTWCWQILNGQRVRVPVQVSGKGHLAWQGPRIAVVIDPLKLSVLRPELLKE